MEEIEVGITIRAGLRIRVLQSASADAVLERAIRDNDVDPYAHIVWPSSVAAAQVVARIARPGMRILDVGAGTGLCALTAAVIGADATALDRDAGSLDRITRAALLNGVTIRTACFDISGPMQLPECDIAVFADLLYENGLASLAAMRVAELRGCGCTCVVADPGRAGRATFDASARGRGIAVAYDDVVVQLPGDVPATVQVAVIS